METEKEIEGEKKIKTKSAVVIILFLGNGWQLFLYIWFIHPFYTVHNNPTLLFVMHVTYKGKLADTSKRIKVLDAMFSNLCNLVSGIFMTLCQSFLMDSASSHVSQATKWTLMGLDFKTYELLMISGTVCAFENKSRIEGLILHCPKYARTVSQARISSLVNSPDEKWISKRQQFRVA